jgi:rhamnogalacturonyl hydrolase YesR
MAFAKSTIVAILLCLFIPQAQAAQKQDILRLMERVADWELAHIDTAHQPLRHPDDAKPLGWVVGTFYTGLTALADHSANPRYADAVFALGERSNWGLGERPFHADDYEVAQNWIWAFNRKHDPRMIAAVKQRFDAIITANPSNPLTMTREPGGCFQRWCWCDALFMAPAGWMALSQTTKDARYQAYADKEYKASTDFLRDPQENLFYRDSNYFERRGPHNEKIFWSRGNGWVYGGLARILTVLPKDSPSRAYYQDLFVKMSVKLITLQKPDGSWPPSLLDPSANTPPETSGTGFYVYGLAWGVRAGILKDPAYRKAAERGWTLISKAVAKDGKLGWVQPVGAQPDNVHADQTQPFGVGAFLLAGSAMIDIG